VTDSRLHTYFIVSEWFTFICIFSYNWLIRVYIHIVL